LRSRTTVLAIAAIAAASLLGAPLAAHADTAPAPSPSPAPWSSASASTIAPPSGVDPVDGNDARLLDSQDGYNIYQYDGADRYEVAAFITFDVFEKGVPVLYIASGEKYPDALSAGPAAAHQGGGLLLVTHDSIPAITLEAIGELEPQKIVVVGGINTISAGVYDQLATLQPSIVRIDGADRYEVSRNIVDYAFCDLAPGVEATECSGTGASQMFVATGANFPDALAAGPAAAHLEGAVLLVPGSASGLDEPTRELLDRAGATAARIAGGPNSVSTSIEDELRSTLGYAIRYSGADRFEVAASINDDVFRSKVATVYIASGLVFSDALSAGPAAAAEGSPLFLVRPYCYPLPTAQAIFAGYLEPDNLVLMGGPNTIGDGISTNPTLCE
jgi:putative cell wall-binding protein